MSKKDYNNKERTQWIAYQYSEKELKKLKVFFVQHDVSDIKREYKPSEESDWTILEAKNDLTYNYNLKQIQFRDWDYRFTSLSKSKGSLVRPSFDKIGRHFEKPNIGLLFENGVTNKFNHVFITDKYADFHCIGKGTRLALFYFYNGIEHKDMLILEFTDAETKYANFTEGFIKNYLEKINFETTPESILAYIYAVLHSPVYRKKYIEFLKTDFPAVPMTKEKEVFKKYAALGDKLIDYHLLKNLPKDNEIRVAGNIPDKDFIIEKIRHANGKLSVTTLENKTIIFEDVTFEIYNFEIGSYRPVENG